MPHHLKRECVVGAFRRNLLAVVLSMGVACNAGAQQAAVDPILENQAAADQGSQASQRRINDLDDEITLSTAENRFATQELERLKIYIGNLQDVVSDQEREMRSVERQIAEFGDIEKDIVPFMFELIESLESFVELDIPFLQVERQDRLKRLRTGMDRSDLTVSEKYRLIMEAYQIEASYGRNIEAYIDTLEIDGVSRRVDLLRVGRVLFAYQTLDGGQTAYWDRHTAGWIESDGSFRREIADGLRIARKQLAPRLLELPLPAAAQ